MTSAGTDHDVVDVVPRPRSGFSGLRAQRGDDAVEACCAILYGDPTIELVLGPSLHPGGLAATEALLSAAGLQPGTRLLDLGCGTGSSAWLASSLAGVRVTGLDTSDGALARARSRGSSEGNVSRAAIDGAHPTFVRGTATDLPFEDSSFDVVLAECVLSTLDKDQAIAEVHRVLTPGGRLLLSDMIVSGDAVLVEEPVHPIIGAALCLSGAWRPGELAATLAAFGFVIRTQVDGVVALRAMLDAVSARIDLLRVVRRDIGARLGERLGAVGAGTFEDAVAALAWARDAVADGRIGYTTVTATRPTTGTRPPSEASDPR